jgi:hypothetical protein
MDEGSTTSENSATIKGEFIDVSVRTGILC